MNRLSRVSAETWLTLFFVVLSLCCLAFMSQLVAESKVLFGRSLTPIQPTLFPIIILSALGVLSLWQIWVMRSHWLSDEPMLMGGKGFRRVVFLFAIMLVYALAMDTVGFFISSAIAMGMIGFVAGNRVVVQILLVSIVAPVLLYLVATRGLAVSLPELSVIEFAYAGLFNR
ncbi:MAG: tripartite tricarboxylate transporter TctB family protein [Stappiaceae bacterium]